MIPHKVCSEILFPLDLQKLISHQHNEIIPRNLQLKHFQSAQTLWVMIMWYIDEAHGIVVFLIIEVTVLEINISR